MEPGEKFIRRLPKFVFMILAFIVAIVFGESYRGMGWIGALIFIIGASTGALGMYLLKDLRNWVKTTSEWVFIGFALVWLATPWALVALAWRKWVRTRTQESPFEDFIDDPAFLFGQILASVSCCALAAILIPAITQLHIKALDKAPDVGLVISAVSALIGISLLPFAVKRAKWLPFVSCLLNVSGIAFLFIASIE
jgi:hypothetical protein